MCLDSLEGRGRRGVERGDFPSVYADAGRAAVGSSLRGRPAPASIAFRLPDLRSRLLSADVWQLQELDDEEQVRRCRSARRGAGSTLADDAALLPAPGLPRDMHSLCGVLDRLDEASLVAQRRLTVPFLRQALAAQADADRSPGE